MKIPKTVLYVSLIVLLGFALRTISAYYVDIGSDEIIYSLIPYNIISAGRLSTIEQAPLYFYLVDIGYKIEGGISPLSTRWPSIVFGALASIVLFLVSLELFQNKKAAYLSAFLFAVSGYAIRWNQEMDMTAYFFSVLSVYFFIVVLRGVPTREETTRGEMAKPYFIYLTAGFLALATLAKPIVLLFLPAYALVGLIHRGRARRWRTQQDRDSRKSIGKTLLLAGLIMLLVVMPVLVYNYLLYKEKGMTDYYFTVLAGVGSSGVYAGQEATPWSFTNFLRISKQILFVRMWRYDALILVVGFLGLGFAWKKEKYGTALLLLTMLFLLFYLAGKMGSPTHYVWIPLILSIFAGYGLVRMYEWTYKWMYEYMYEYVTPGITSRTTTMITTRFTPKIALKIVQKIRFRYVLALVVLLLSLNTASVMKEITPLQKSSIQHVLQEYATENIPAEAIVVLDPRIYRGIYAWAFYNQHYLEGIYFPELTQNLNSLPGLKQEIPLYYIECGPGKYCGWKPEDFQRIYGFGEQLSSLFQKNMKKIGELKAIDQFIIYQGSLSASPAVYEMVDRTHSHWYTPIGWKYPELAIDTYTPKTLWDKMLNYVGFLILYADVAIALLSLPLVFFLLGRRSG